MLYLVLFAGIAALLKHRLVTPSTNVLVYCPG